MYPTWSPQIGTVFSTFIEAQPLEAQISVQESSLKILGRCRNPGSIGDQKSHLVVGEVQSGKTMSFTGVIALARDNKIPVIVVLGGTKVTLVQQTVTRLTSDLRVGGDGGVNPWALYEVHNKVEPEKSIQKKRSEINQILDQWNDPNVPSEFCPTIVIATVKTRPSLDAIAKVFNKLGRTDLDKTPVLIIDDEVDQAGLNVAKKKDEESSVYAAIGRLRQTFPNNDYLMYTATPQATLLLEIAAHQDPETVTVLDSGPDYVGGKDLFGESNHFVINIPPSDVAMATQPDKQPPHSLKVSLAYFLISLAIAQKRGNPKPCSMLIHPGTGTLLHSKHAEWTEAILGMWRTLLADVYDPAFEECLASDFAEAFSLIEENVDLTTVWTGVEKEMIKKDIGKYIRLWIPQIKVLIMNSTPDAEDVSPDEWRSHPGWILIGGFNLERGFTVENLTVTYMPRGAGVGNADSIQQRGRFFGYKRKYFDILKGWLAADVADAFRDYITHETHMRNELKNLDLTEGSIRDWRRKLLLDPSWKPTRKSVIRREIRHDKFTKGFIFSQRLLCDPCLQDGKIKALSQLNVLMADSERHVLDNRSILEEGAHLSRKIMIAQILGLLTDMPMTPEDRDTLDSRILALQNLVDDDENIECELTFMGSLNLRGRKIESSTMSGEEKYYRVENLMAGRTGNYIGDQKLVSDDLVTIQIHHVAPHTDSRFDFLPALAVAIHWPVNLRQGVIWELDGQRG
jgi:hypothetical protein